MIRRITKISMNIESVKATDDGIDVKVKRNSGEANLVGLNFVVSNGENTEVFEVETDMKELATQTFSLDYDGLVQSVEVAPVLANDEGKEKVYDSIDVEELSLEESLTSLSVVSWWKMEGNAEDEVSGNDGELVGDTDCSVEGVYGKACEFDGDGDYINVGSRDNLQINGGVTQVGWVNMLNSDSSNLLTREGQEYDLRYSMFIRNGTITSQWYDGSSFSTINTDSVVTPYSWTQVAVVRESDGVTIKFYVNGESVYDDVM
ncbi:MAG: LamG domain-containing protein, partial [Ignavibacteriaceae bacterium]|nr:LamG domain-containing protein [Ignavibacteriaceae bacterium]